MAGAVLLLCSIANSTSFCMSANFLASASISRTFFLISSSSGSTGTVVLMAVADRVAWVASVVARIWESTPRSSVAGCSDMGRGMGSKKKFSEKIFFEFFFPKIIFPQKSPNFSQSAIN